MWPRDARSGSRVRWGVTAAARESITGCVVEATPLHPTNTPARFRNNTKILTFISELNHTIISVFGPFAVAKKLRRRQLMTNVAHVSVRLIAKAVRCVFRAGNCVFFAGLLNTPHSVPQDTRRTIWTTQTFLNSCVCYIRVFHRLARKKWITILQCSIFSPFSHVC